jgi:hypothetical protein
MKRVAQSVCAVALAAFVTLPSALLLAGSARRR